MQREEQQILAIPAATCHAANLAVNVVSWLHIDDPKLIKDPRPRTVIETQIAGS
jgi:hypothetical protein